MNEIHFQRYIELWDTVSVTHLDKSENTSKNLSETQIYILFQNSTLQVKIFQKIYFIQIVYELEF